jgi:hypothetical protein
MEYSDDRAIRVATSVLRLSPRRWKATAVAQFSSSSCARNRLTMCGEHRDQIPVRGKRVRARKGTLVQSLAEGVEWARATGESTRLLLRVFLVCPVLDRTVFSEQVIVECPVVGSRVLEPARADRN